MRTNLLLLIIRGSQLRIEIHGMITLIKYQKQNLLTHGNKQQPRHNYNNHSPDPTLNTTMQFQMKMPITGLTIRTINRTNKINHINLNKLNLQITSHSKLRTQTHGLKNNLTINIAQTNNHLKSIHLSIIKIMIPGLEKQKKLQTQMKL